MRWLCLDPGEKRTGVALSSPEETFAVPLTVLEHGPEGLLLDQLDDAMREHVVEALLIGIPVSMDDTLSAQSRAAIDTAVSIATHVRGRLVVPHELTVVRDVLANDVDYVDSVETAGRMPVMLWDERLSTWSARRALCASGSKKRGRQARPGRLDAHAAAVILQSYLDTAAEIRRREYPRDESSTSG